MKEVIMNEFEAFIRWSVAGDGCVSIPPRCINAKYNISRKEKHKDYIEYLYNKFKSLSDIKFNVCKSSDGYIELYSRVNELLTEIRYTQYIKKGKTKQNRKLYLPMLEAMTAEHLALLYMDDGSYSKQTDVNSYQLKISIHSYSYEEQQLLVNTIKDKFNIEFNINNDDDGYLLQLKVKYHQDFFDIVSPYIAKSYQYKLPKKSH